MAQRIPIYIPTYISDQNYKPARVLPRLFFYNGKLECEQYWMQFSSGSTTTMDAFPYFDNYNVVTGSFPTTDSYSLLFNNEAAAYGEIPTGSLYSEYWSNWIQFLYNPTTRLLRTEGIIPLSDYFELQLNDIVSFRGNLFHLRALNDYNITTGECQIELIGPIIANAADRNVAPAVNYGDFNCDWNADFDGTFVRSLC